VFAQGNHVRVSLSKSDRSFSVAPAQPVLEAALEARLNLPHSCKGGNCGACRARLLEGEVAYPNGRPLGLSEAEVSDGFILLCQARALTDLSIETREIGSADTVVVKRLPSRIEDAQALCHDVLCLFLRLPAAEDFHFQAGQYIDILLPGGRRRSFSIASPPHDSRLLELHVRRVPGGEFTDGLFAGDPRNGLLTIEGPLGHFVYRPDSAAPMVLIGGGTGLAPLKSILRHVVENDLRRDMVLYWGVRSERDLYAHAELERLVGRAPNFRYRPVLSEPDDTWRGRRGWVHEAVLKDGVRLEDADIYASGPPAMVDAVRDRFVAHGADPARLYFDSFDYAPDSLSRQRTIAPTKS
jgi:CDP-4-dehydro-6-deoxyglucose reductase